MNQNKQNLAVVLLGFIAVFTLALLLKSSPAAVVNVPPIEIPALANLGAVTNYLDTSSHTIAFTNTAVNVTSTQMFSSITKIAQVINQTSSQVVCAMDATGTTAASSSVSLVKGIVLGPVASTTPSSAMFGECYPGAFNCYAHKGAVNCIASATTTVTKWSK